MAGAASETRAYIRGQVSGAALVNAALNPLIEWGLNRSKGFQPLWGSDGVVLNMVLTSIILSVLVALFTARGVHHQLAAGRIVTMRARLPGRAGVLGLLLGVGAAMVVVLVFWLLDAIGVAGMPFWGLLMLKAGYWGAWSRGASCCGCSARLRDPLRIGEGISQRSLAHHLRDFVPSDDAEVRDLSHQGGHQDRHRDE